MAILSSSCAFGWSKWNCSAPLDQVVIKVKLYGHWLISLLKLIQLQYVAYIQKYENTDVEINYLGLLTFVRSDIQLTSFTS